MSTEDATEVLGILFGSHDGCVVCAEEQVIKFLGLWPEHMALAIELFEKNFGEPLNVLGITSGKTCQ